LHTFKTHINSIFVLWLLIIQTSSSALTLDETNNQQWFQYNNQIKLNNKFSILSDVGIRYKDNFNSKNQFIIRSAFKYSVNNIAWVIGVGNFNYYHSEQINKIEFRPFQELSIKHVVSNIELQQRIRTEQQIFNTNEMNFYEYLNRIRYRLMNTIPIKKFNQSENKIELIVGNEIFFVGKNNLSLIQNRILIGTSFTSNKFLSVLFLYNLQSIYKIKSENSKIDHIFWLSFIHYLDFTTSKK